MSASAGVRARFVDRALLRLRGLISRSLAEVRLKQGIVHLEEFRADEFIREIADAGSSEATARGIRIELKQDGARSVIKADRQLLATTVMTLLLNALKFTRPGTTVTLEVRAAGDRLHINVEDECGGIHGNNLERSFRPLEQKSANRDGLGPGLSFAQKAIEAIGGRISVRNVPKIDSVFTVDLQRVLVPISTVAQAGQVVAGPLPLDPSGIWRRNEGRASITAVHSVARA